MTEDGTRRARRSGCAVFAGGFLIIVGSLALGANVFGAASFARAAMSAIVWYGAYWPVLLILWGTYKIYVRFAHPDRAYVGGGEVVVLIWIIVSGLAVRSTERAMNAHSLELSWNGLASVIGTDLLGPAHYFTDQERFEADGLRSLVVESERGEIAIRGWDENRVEVVVTKRVYDLSKDKAERIASAVGVNFETEGESARLNTVHSGTSRFVFVDLDLRIPRALALTVHHGEGPVGVENVDGAVDVSTTHAPIEAENLSGGLEAQTTHAPIRLERIVGRADARSRHGSISAKHIDGDLHAETRNASILVEDVTGTATLKTRHARVRAKDVGGDLSVTAHHAKVDVERVTGNVMLETSARPVYVSGVGGELSLVTKSSITVVRGISGRVAIENQNRRVSVSNVTGDVIIKSKQGAIDIDSVAGGVDIESSYEDILIADFTSSLRVHARHAPVSVTTTRLSGAVRVETSYADVNLTLPSNLSARFTARARDGEVRSEFPRAEHRDDAVSEVSDDTWEATFGEGTFPVSVETSYGDIVITKVEP